MFDIAWGEFAVIAIVALIVIGPKELPAVLRALGQWTARVRRMAAEFQGQFQEALREAEMADLKKEVDEFNARAEGFKSQLNDPLSLQDATAWEPKPEPDAAKVDDAAVNSAEPGPNEAGPTTAAEPPAASETVGTPPDAAPAAAEEGSVKVEGGVHS